MRAGELLQEHDGRGNNQHSGDAPTTLSQRAAAEQAGFSKDQAVQAVRVAKVPRELFEELIEAEPPATVTQLARIGTPTSETVRQQEIKRGAASEFIEKKMMWDRGLGVADQWPARARPPPGPAP